MAKKKENRINVIGLSVASLQLAKEFVGTLGIVAILVLTGLLAQCFQFGTYKGQVPQKVFQDGQTSRTYCQMLSKSWQVRRINALNAVMSTIYALVPTLAEAKSPEEEVAIINQEVEMVANPSGGGKILSEEMVKNDPENRIKSEKGKAAQSLGLQQTAPIFKPGTFAIQIPIKTIDLSTILEFAEFFWDKLNTGISFEEAFRNQMAEMKPYWNRQIGDYDPDLDHPSSKYALKEVSELSNKELVAILIHSIYMEIFETNVLKIFERNPFNTPEELTPLETQLGFIERTVTSNNITEIVKNVNRKSKFIDAGIKQLSVGDKTAKKTKRDKKKGTEEKMVWDAGPRITPEVKKEEPPKKTPGKRGRPPKK